MNANSKIIFTHDMTTEDREEYKRLVADAKDKEKAVSYTHLTLPTNREV